jgi:hypothetical protein
LYHALGFIAERMSLGVAIFVCAMLGTVRPRLAVRWALLAVAIVFFGFLYSDERAVNGFDDRMENLVARAPSQATGGQAGNGPHDAPSTFARRVRATARDRFAPHL